MKYPRDPKEIEVFLNKMDKMLTHDLKDNIVKRISFEKNLQIIKQQKMYKYILQKQLNIVLHTVYNDGNMIIYKHEASGRLMLQNNLNQNYILSIYNLSDNPEENNSTQIHTVDDIGVPIHTINENRGIKLCILYS